MNRFRQLIIAILGFGLAVGSVAFAQETKLGEPQVRRSGKLYVQVYFEENFKGKSVRLEAPCELNNDARLREKGIANDSIQSMKIPDGVVVTLYDAAGFGGKSQSFTGKAATLGDLKGQASSLKAEIKSP